MYQFTYISIRIKGNLPLCQVSIVIVLVSHLGPNQGQVFLLLFLFFFSSLTVPGMGLTLWNGFVNAIRK